MPALDSAINLKSYNLQFACDIQTIYENATFAGNGKNLPAVTGHGVALPHNKALGLL
jgi:hypothetical protein